MLNQVSLFTENNEGGLFKITTILAKANINIYTMLANDSAEFGIVRLIVDKAETAIEVLKAKGYQCRQDKVIAVEMNGYSGLSGRNSCRYSRCQHRHFLSVYFL